MPDINESVRATRVNWDTCCVQPASFYAGNETKFTNQWTILKQSLILNFILISRTCWAKLDLKGCTCSSLKKKKKKKKRRRKLQARVFFSNRTGRKTPSCSYAGKLPLPAGGCGCVVLAFSIEGSALSSDPHLQ